MLVKITDSFYCDPNEVQNITAENLMQPTWDKTVVLSYNTRIVFKTDTSMVVSKPIEEVYELLQTKKENL